MYVYVFTLQNCISLRSGILTYSFERKLSCAFCFEATHLDIHATRKLFELQRVVQEKQDNFARCGTSLKRDFLKNFDGRKFSFGSFLMLHVKTYTPHQFFSSYNMQFWRYKLIFYYALFLLVKSFLYVRICLYSAKLYFLMKWYSYIFFREKTLLCLVF